MKNACKRFKPLQIWLTVLILGLLTACDAGKAPADTTGAADTDGSTSADTTAEEKTAAETAADTAADTAAVHVHAFGEWTTTREATCLDIGKQKRSCPCGETEEQKLKKTDHVRRSLPTVQPTVTENGSEGGAVCSVCGEVLEEATVLPYIGHTGLLYSISESTGTCTVTGRGTCTEADLYIPAYIEGYKVTHIGAAAFLHDALLTSVTLPDTLETIDVEAFCHCVNLETVHFPDGLWMIGADAFSFCSSLTRLELPDSLTTVELRAFWQCTSLSEVVFPENLTWIRTRAFAGCTSLTRVVLPEKVTTVDDDAFGECEGLTEIYLPASIRKLGTELVHPFRECDALTDIYYGGTQTQWEAISVADDYDPFPGERELHCNAKPADLSRG